MKILFGLSSMKNKLNKKIFFYKTMSVNLSGLTTYVDENKMGLIANAILGARTSKYLTLQTGVKGATSVNILNTNVEFGNGATCGWNEDGE